MVNVTINFGSQLYEAFTLEIDFCSLVSGSRSFPLISGGTIDQGNDEYLKFCALQNNFHHVKALSNKVWMMPRSSNDKVGFQWKVFSIGRTDRIQIDCSMFVKRNLYSSTITETSTATIPSVIQNFENNQNGIFSTVIWNIKRNLGTTETTLTTTSTMKTATTSFMTTSEITTPIMSVDLSDPGNTDIISG